MLGTAHLPLRELMRNLSTFGWLTADEFEEAIANKIANDIAVALYTDISTGGR